jgi:hypothetical protein
MPLRGVILRGTRSGSGWPGCRRPPGWLGALPPDACHLRRRLRRLPAACPLHHRQRRPQAGPAPHDAALRAARAAWVTQPALHEDYRRYRPRRAGDLPGRQARRAAAQTPLRGHRPQQQLAQDPHRRTQLVQPHRQRANRKMAESRWARSAPGVASAEPGPVCC